jgi:hypothetical protein
MGSAFGVAFDTPVEMVGYSLLGGDGFLWTDLYWRGTEEHFQPYLLSLYLLDQKTGEVVASGSEMIPKLEWRNGDLLQERRVLWLNDVPQGQYSLGVALGPKDEPEQRFPARDPQSGEVWPENLAILDVPVLVLPAGLKEVPVSRQGRIVAYTAATGVGVEPETETQASFGGMAELTGYSVEPLEATVGQELVITLYWRPGSEEPPTRDYTVFVHLLDESGQLIGQHDGEPAGGRRPTHTWQAGDVIIDPHPIEWKMEGYSGRATIAVGLYDLQTLERLPAYGPDGERWPDDRVIAGELAVRH